MGICVFQLEKELLRILQQYIKVSGVKSKKDFKEIIYMDQSRVYADDCLNEF